MKFIAALIATAAAVRDEDMQYDGGMDMEMPAFDLPQLSEAAELIAGIEDFTVDDLAALGDLPHDELVDLGVWCTL